MNKLFLISILLILGGLVSVSFISAAYSNDPFNHRYQGDPYKSSASNYRVNNIHDYSYSRYNIANTASRPIFKGPYGNYRYEMYANGDYRPSLFFRSYDGYGGGYGGGYGYGGYPSFGGGYGYGGYGLGYGSYYSYYAPGPYFTSYLF